jgi:hypothetical protein
MAHGNGPKPSNRPNRLYGRVVFGNLNAAHSSSGALASPVATPIGCATAAMLITQFTNSSTVIAIYHHRLHLETQFTIAAIW